MTNKLIMTFLLAMVLLSCTRKSPSEDSEHIVLFVCTHGAARSPIAAAYFNKLAKQEGLNYKAIFRGTAPDENLTDGTVNGLVEDGFDVAGWKPLSVSSDDIKSADKIVTFDCSLPSANGAVISVEQWNGTPAISKDYNAARDAILSEVTGLLVKLKGEAN